MSSSGRFDILAVLSTAIIAWGVFPQRPQFLSDWFNQRKNPYAVWVQWAALLLLFWQGQADRDFGKALVATLILFVVVQIALYFESKSNKGKLYRAAGRTKYAKSKR